MSTLTLVLLFIVLPVLLWALWFVIEFVRYLFTGEYDVDQRLQNIRR